MMSKFLHRLHALSHKKKCLMSFFLGSLSSLAMPPLSLFPLLFFGLSLLYVLTAAAASTGRAFSLGWFFGFGYFAFGLYWIGNALLVEGNPYAWAWPLAVCGLPALLAFFPAFACLLARRFSSLENTAGFFAFCAWTAFFEFARSFVFTGFPWNLYGHAWTDVLPVLQILSVSDVYGLTTLTVFWCALPGFLMISNISHRKKMVVSGVLLAVFVFCFAFGVSRLQQPPPPDRAASIHLVQANIPQSEKWNPDKMWPHFLKHLDMSKPDADAPSGGQPTYIVWAETALSQWLYQDPRAALLIRDMLNLYDGPAYLLTGFLRKENGRYYNSLVMIDKAGTMTNIYNKNHLVPFGEYIPFQRWIPLEPIAKFNGFSGGKGPQSLRTPENLLYSPMICYEIIFSGAVTDPGQKPDFILNVTNDSWYGKSAGPYQHLSQAAFRAIEEGIPVIRVAETGVSAVIGSKGETLEKSPLFDEYEKTVALPGRNMLSRDSAVYRHAALLAVLCIFIAIGFVFKKD